MAKQPNSPPTGRSRKSNKLREWINRSTFLLGAILFHFILFLMVMTLVIFPAFHPPQTDFKPTYLPEAAPPPPPPQSVTVAIPTPVQAPMATPIINPNAPAQDFNLPPPDMATVAPTMTSKPQASPQENNTLANSKRMSAIKNAVMTGQGRSASDIASSDGDPRNIKTAFPIYLASYANGDWSCNSLFSNGKITGGSLPNLVEKINQWSHGNIKGEVVPTPLQISSPELLTKAPPFIFFTGHKDFVLTDAEILNLQKYLNSGGLIWGDNALPGNGSRFDVAFRREMKRVLPDKDKNFEPIDLSHDIFTKSWFPITKLPTGMNYYQEPIEKIDIDGKMAVLYTVNDYSDMFFFHILMGDDKADSFPWKYLPLKSSDTMLMYNQTFFRNFELEPALAAQKLGMNIVGYLLVRFDKELLLTP